MKDFNSSLVLAVDEVLDFIKRHISMEVIFLGKAERDDVWDYPLDSLKEAIINALVHRDYFDSGNIQIRIFDNRLEIWSPGLLPKEIDIKNLFKEHRSIPRNKEIVKIFHDIELIEGWGSGFKRMREECFKNGNSEPEFSEKTGAFIITLRKRKKSSEKSSEKILDIIRNNLEISAKELSKKLDISQRAVEKNIAKLKQAGSLKRIGSDKGGRWLILFNY